MRKLLILTCLVSLLCGCRDDFVFSVPPERAYEYNLLSELSPNRIVSVQLLESVPIGNELQNIDRRDAIAVFKGDDVPGGQLEMAFNATSEKYHLVNEDFRVSEGSSYEVSIIIPDEKMDTIQAFTSIPESMGFTIDVLSTEQVIIDDEFSHHFIDVVIDIEQPTQVPVYYQLVPYRLKSSIKIGANGQVDLIDSPDLSLLDVVEVQSNQNSISTFAHQEGIIIEESRMSSSKLHLRLRTNGDEPLRDGEAVSIMDGKDALNRLNFELITVNPEIYDYHKWVDERLINQGSNLPSAPREIPNITNASGVFGGASRTLMQVRVNE